LFWSVYLALIILALVVAEVSVV